jgi:hypothetical protein
MHLSVWLSTQILTDVPTYAQNSCGGKVIDRLQTLSRYESHSAAKLLICIDFLKCFFYWQSGESLDLQGLPRSGANLSTKLSTEKVGFVKALLNQALSAFFASFLKKTPTMSQKLG